MKPFVMYRPRLALLIFWTIFSTVYIFKYAIDFERDSGNGLTVLGVGFFAVLAAWAILRLVFIRKMVLDSDTLVMTHGTWMHNSIPLTEWKRVQFWVVPWCRRKPGFSFGKIENSNACLVVIDTLRGQVKLPIFENFDVLNNFQAYMDALFLSLPVEAIRPKKFDGLLLDPVSDVPQEPYHDVIVALRPGEERLERLSGISLKKSFSTRLYVYLALT